MDRPLRLIRPAARAELFLRFFFELRGDFDALGGAFLFEFVAAARAIRRQHAHPDDRHTHERRNAADEDEEPVDRARRVGRHISW
jgi:hypothetical protein